MKSGRFVSVITTRGSLRRAILALFVMALVAIFGDLISNEKPLYAHYNGFKGSPVMNHFMCSIGMCTNRLPEPTEGWRHADYDFAIFAPIPYSASTLNPTESYEPPLSYQAQSPLFTHWLGTDPLGRDVTAILIRGCRIALLVGVGSMLLAMLIGVPLGACAGYLGNDRMWIKKRGWAVFLVLLLMCIWFIVQCANGLSARNWGYAWLGLAGLALAAGLIWVRSYLLSADSRLLRVPFDTLVMRGVEIIRSVPAIFLLFALLAMISEPGILFVVVLIAVIRTPTLVRYTRAEALRIAQLPYIDSARVAGLRSWQIIWRHVVPNSLGPVFVTMAFGMGGAVLIESTLSFLGIGLSIDQMSWGRLLGEARANFSAWWLAVFPGLAIFIIIAIFNRIGVELNRHIKVEETT